MPASRPLLVALLVSLTPCLNACGDDGGGTGSSDSSSEGSSDATAGASSSSTGDDPTSTSSASTEPATDPTTDDATSATSTETSATSDPGTTTGGADELPPTDSAAQLEQWLADGAYKSWPAESQIHGSAGPHGGNVRTFVNPALADSLASEAAMHPQGAASVKELYGAGTDAIIGYAVMVKLAPDSAGGDGWYWYERLDATVYADDTGVGLCTGCHGGGADYVLTPYPLQ